MTTLLPPSWLGDPVATLDHHVYLEVAAREETQANAQYVCWHKLSLRSALLDLIQSATFSMPQQGFRNDKHTTSTPPFVMQLGPCWGLPHVTVELLLKSGDVIHGLFADNLPAQNSSILLCELGTSSGTPMSSNICLCIKATEETSSEFEYRCWHKIWLSSGQLNDIKSVTYNMPGQGFRRPSTTVMEPPFVMQFGPCWGLPHVTVSLLLENGATLAGLFNDNLPSKDARVLIHDLSAPPVAPKLDCCLASRPIVRLNALRMAEPYASQVAADHLRMHGFVWLDLQGDELKPATSVLNAAHSFLAGPGRGTGSHEALVGHISSAHKDSIRLMTGNQWPNNPKLHFSNRLHKLATALDAAQLCVVTALAGPLFSKVDANDVAKAFDIPLPLYQEAVPQSGPQFALLDIALYRMERGSPVPMAVSEHVDPGLLVLSLPQSVEGLELQDASGEWYAPPSGMGVLWAGARAAAAGVAGGRHRVRSGDTPRFACWHELCTNEQISPPMLQRISSEHRELELGPVKGTKKVLRTLRRAEDHAPSVAALGVELFGAPSSKSAVSIGPPRHLFQSHSQSPSSSTAMELDGDLDALSDSADE